MRDPNDWRLNSRERYLQGVTLTKRAYSSGDIDNDHDHCEFCGAKFMMVTLPETLQHGYATADGHRWICSDCFDDFSDMFRWKVATDDKECVGHKTYTALLSSLLAGGASLEEGLSSLHASGATPIETIKAIRAT